MREQNFFYQVDHYTEFEYSSYVCESAFILTLQAINTPNQKITDFKLTLQPKAKPTYFQDCYGNHKHCFNILERHKKVFFHSSFKVHITQKETSSQQEVSHTETLVLAKKNHLKKNTEDNKLEMWDWLSESHFTKNSKELKSFLSKHQITKKENPLSSLKFLNSKLFEIFEYSPGATHSRSFIKEILTTHKGVCQDYSHVMIAIARLWGIPARYASGYLYQDKINKGFVLPDQSHAWCECYLGDWIGFDPTNNSLASERHIVLAVGRDYKDVLPHHGFFKGAETKQMQARVAIKKITN